MNKFKFDFPKVFFSCEICDNTAVEVDSVWNFPIKNLVNNMVLCDTCIIRDEMSRKPK